MTWFEGWWSKKTCNNILSLSGHLRCFSGIVSKLSWVHQPPCYLHEKKGIKWFPPKTLAVVSVWFLRAMLFLRVPMPIISCAQSHGSLEEDIVVLIWSMSGGSCVHWTVAWFEGLINLGMSSAPWARCCCWTSGFINRFSRARHPLTATVLYYIQRGHFNAPVQRLTEILKQGLQEWHAL